MKQPLVIYWARRDLRLTDNPALIEAVRISTEKGIPFLPLFILEDYMVSGNPLYQFGYPSRYFLARALPEFGKQFKQFGIIRGKAAQYFIELQKRYELTIIVNDDVYRDFYTQVKKIRGAGISIQVCEDALSVSKETRTGEGKLYSVFTPFKKSVWASFIAKRNITTVDVSQVEYADTAVLASLKESVSNTVDSLWGVMHKSRLLKILDTEIDLDTLIEKPDLEMWYVSENDALNRFDAYLKTDLLDAYSANRDSLERDSDITEGGAVTLEGMTSRMSLALAWGLVSSRMLVSRMQNHFGEPFDNPFSDRVSQGALTYISELIWREFYRYQLFHHPELMYTEFQERFRGTIQWVPQKEAYDRFTLWIQGKTGYPVVDAAMRQLAKTGWMHNRARMIVASILTKNLGVDWRWGQEYFRAALIDLDEASNNGGWQWGASVGADPKPIRIFNPELQAKNYDGRGVYIERWLSSSESILKEEIVPIVEHRAAREEALVRYGLSNTKPRDY